MKGSRGPHGIKLIVISKKKKDFNVIKVSANSLVGSGVCKKTWYCSVLPHKTENKSSQAAMVTVNKSASNNWALKISSWIEEQL